MTGKTIAALGVALALGGAAGFLLGRSEPSGGSPQAAADAPREPLYWVAPMDPGYRRDAPGTSPMGMDLVPVYEEDEAETGVRISPEVAHNFGVRVAPARRAPLDAPVLTVGTVELAEPLVEHVHTRSAGWIERLVADAEGDPVTAGEVLLELYSPELVRAQEELLLAREPALARASEDRLRALGMSPAQIAELRARGSVSERLALRASRDGFVMDLSVREGMYVEPRTEVLAVAALDPVWVVAEVYERDVPELAKGQPARLEFDFLPGRTFEGTVDYLYPTLDPESRTLRVRMVFPNPETVLRPGMFGRVRIRTSERRPVLTVPASAVIRGTGDAPDRVVVEIGDGRFRSRAVRIGRVEPDRVEILAGLREGEPVVVSGQFLIDSESDVDAELLRMGAEEAAGAMDHSAMEHGAMDHSAMEHGGTPAPEQGATDHSAMDHSTMEHGGTPAPESSAMDHSAMEHGGTPASEQGAMDHSAMDHSTMEHGGTPAPESAAMDHSAMEHGGTPAPEQGAMDHSAMDHSAMDHSAMEHGGTPAPESAAMDHSAMEHGGTPAPEQGAMDHSAMDHSAMEHGGTPAPESAAMDHSAMDHSAMEHGGQPAPRRGESP